MELRCAMKATEAFSSDPGATTVLRKVIEKD
jgi:hypothetical protein